MRLKDAGIDSLGMHLEAVTPEVRARIMPGKAQVSIELYLEAFADAVAVFGRGQVSTYILAGLGDTPEAILSLSETLITLGVYPFVVPFVPISGTPLEHHPAPDSAFMSGILQPLGGMLNRAGLRSSDIKAGCGRCGACSSCPVLNKRWREVQTMENYSGYTIKWVTLPWERERAYALRQRVFCQEQRLFDDHDIDAIDGSARLIVALGNVGAGMKRW